MMQIKDGRRKKSALLSTCADSKSVKQDRDLVAPVRAASSNPRHQKVSSRPGPGSRGLENTQERRKGGRRNSARVLEYAYRRQEPPLARNRGKPNLLQSNRERYAFDQGMDSPTGRNLRTLGSCSANCGCRCVVGNKFIHRGCALPFRAYTAPRAAFGRRRPPP